MTLMGTVITFLTRFGGILAVCFSFFLFAGLVEDLKRGLQAKQSCVGGVVVGSFGVRPRPAWSVLFVACWTGGQTKEIFDRYSLANPSCLL